MKGTCQYCQFETQAGRLARNASGLLCKADIPCFNRLLRREREAQSKLRRVMHVGARLAAACLCLSRSERLNLADRATLSGMYADWDRVKK